MNACMNTAYFCKESLINYHQAIAIRLLMAHLERKYVEATQ